MAMINCCKMVLMVKVRLWDASVSACAQPPVFA